MDYRALSQAHRRDGANNRPRNANGRPPFFVGVKESQPWPVATRRKIRADREDRVEEFEGIYTSVQTWLSNFSAGCLEVANAAKSKALHLPSDDEGEAIPGTPRRKQIQLNSTPGSNLTLRPKDKALSTPVRGAISSPRQPKTPLGSTIRDRQDHDFAHQSMRTPIKSSVHAPVFQSPRSARHQVTPSRTKLRVDASAATQKQLRAARSLHRRTQDKSPQKLTLDSKSTIPDPVAVIMESDSTKTDDLVSITAALAPQPTKRPKSIIQSTRTLGTPFVSRISDNTDRKKSTHSTPGSRARDSMGLASPALRSSPHLQQSDSFSILTSNLERARSSGLNQATNKRDRDSSADPEPDTDPKRPRSSFQDSTAPVRFGSPEPKSTEEEQQSRGVKPRSDSGWQSRSNSSVAAESVCESKSATEDAGHNAGARDLAPTPSDLVPSKPDPSPPELTSRLTATKTTLAQSATPTFMVTTEIVQLESPRQPFKRNLTEDDLVRDAQPNDGKYSRSSSTATLSVKPSRLAGSRPISPAVTATGAALQMTSSTTGLSSSKSRILNHNTALAEKRTLLMSKSRQVGRLQAFGSSQTTAPGNLFSSSASLPSASTNFFSLSRATPDHGSSNNSVRTKQAQAPLRPNRPNPITPHMSSSSSSATTTTTTNTNAIKKPISTTSGMAASISTHASTTSTRAHESSDHRQSGMTEVAAVADSHPISRQSAVLSKSVMDLTTKASIKSNQQTISVTASTAKSGSTITTTTTTTNKIAGMNNQSIVPSRATTPSLAPNSLLSSSSSSSSSIKPQPLRITGQSSAASTSGAPTATVSVSIEESMSVTILPEVPSDEEDDEDEQSNSRWMDWKEIQADLKTQAVLNPEEIFGPLPVLEMSEIFPSKKKNSSSSSLMRPRTSSAHWTGSDMLTANEVVKYNEQMGWETKKK